MHIRQTHDAPRTRRFSRLQIITGAIAGLAGFAAAPALTKISPAKAAGYTEDDMLNFVAEGPANTGFAAFAVDTNGVPVFANGAVTVGSTYGLLAKSPNVGIRGGGDNNSTGVMGISFTDSNETSHGSGAGVQGNSGSGSGVAGFSDSNTGVFGESDGASGIGVSGKGQTGVRGAGTNNSVGVHGFTFTDSSEMNSGTGTGVQGDSGTGIGVAGFSDSHIGVYGQASGGVGVQGSGATGLRGGGDNNSTGVLGISFSDNTEMTHGSGTGIQGNSGTGSGVAGFSDNGSGVFGESEGSSGVGVSGKGATGVRGAGTSNSIGVHGFSFTDSNETSAGTGTAVQGDTGSGIGVAGYSDSHIGVYGNAGGTNGVGVQGSGFTGLRGSGDSNSTGVLGVSYADSTETTHGSGTGVQGNSGTGSGVAGFSDSASGVFGEGDGPAGVGVSGKGQTGLRGAGIHNSVGVHGFTFVDGTEEVAGTGTAVQGDSGSGIGVAGFSNSHIGVYGESSSVGVQGSGETGVRGGGTSNSTGVLGISYADATGTTLGSGSGVHGNSNTGPGVSGHSKYAVGVYGAADGVSGIGVSGSGSIGVSGTSDIGIGVQGSSGSDAGVTGISASGSGVVAKSEQSYALEAYGGSPNLPTIYAQTSGKKGSTAGAIQASSAHGFGVLGTTSAAPAKYAVGVGITGVHVNGYGAGVAGYSVKPPQKGKDGGSNVLHIKVVQGCGVFGVGDQAGVYGSSGVTGDGVRGINTANGTGVYGVSFEGSDEKTLGTGNGVQGASGKGSGVAGFSHKGSGVYGQSGVIGVQGKGLIGVLGDSNKGAGVTGQTKSGAGVKGEATSGSGVVAVSASKTQPALVAANSSAGPAIAGTSSSGYGAELAGGQAPLRLIPTASQGSPTSGRHLNGEMMLDSSGNLYLCVQSGTPGSWKRVVLE